MAVELTVAAVKDWLKLTTSSDDALITQCVGAAGRLLARYDAGDGEREDHQLAGIMLAARLYRRRNSPEGVQAMTDAGAFYVARTDPDIARLLRIDQYTTPQVG